MSKDMKYKLVPIKVLRTKDGRFVPKGPWIRNVESFTPEALRRIHEKIAKMPAEKPSVPPLYNGLIPPLRGRMHR